MDKIIIHSDMNSCYASIECSLNPELKGKPVAVGGNEKSRHGIILAKTPEAKKYGVTTGEPLWQARQKCPELIIVEPHFDIYSKYSALAHDIYARYTDRIEPMGLDEAWCDITGSLLAFGGKDRIIREIREAFKSELGITVSVGVSFNKIFAKLASDIAGVDETYEITRNDYKKKVWGLPVSAIMGVGRSTAQKLKRCGIYTIGDLAACSQEWLKLNFGVVGLDMWRYANGFASAEVAKDSYRQEIKSVGHGITCKQDLINNDEVWRVFLSLSQEISKKLKREGLEACGVQISVKDTMLQVKQFQCETLSTQSAFELSKTAMLLFEENYLWLNNIRALTIRAINLRSEDTPTQESLLIDTRKHERQRVIDDAVMDLRQRFGEKAVFNCCLMQESKIPDISNEKSPLPMRINKN